MTLKDIRKEVESMVEFELSKPTRKREYVYARSIYYKLSRELCPLESLYSIAASMNQDHSNVLHSINNVFPSIEAYEEVFYKIYTDVKSRLLHKYGDGDFDALNVKPSAFLGVHKQYVNELSKYKKKYEDIQNKYEESLKNRDKSTIGEAIDMLKRVPESKQYDLLIRLDAMTKIMAL